MKFDLLNAAAPVQGDRLAALIWNEGMQLLPQHFQLLDTRLEHLLRRQMLAAAPFQWGIDQIEWDDAALAAGTLRLAAVSGQFPDGLIFSFNLSQGPALALTLSAAANDEPVCYALAVVQQDFTENGITVGRYRQHIGAPVTDLTNPDESAAIPRWLPNLSIQRWAPLDTRYVQIPFIEVLKTATGFQANGFHPPAVRLLAHSPCALQVTALAQLLRSKAAQLDAPPLPVPLNSDFQAGLGAILAALVSGLPLLEAQLMSGSAHPYQIHLSLCSIAGMVAALTGRAPAYFPAYEHAQPGVALMAVSQYIHGIVSQIGIDQRAWHAVPLTLSDTGWTCPLPRDESAAPLLLCIKFHPSQSDASVTAWLEHVLICLQGDEGRCRALRVKGFNRRQHVCLPEFGLLAEPAQCFIEIETGDNLPAPGSRLLISAQTSQAAAIEQVSLLVASDGSL